MIIEEAIYTYLSGEAGITNLVDQRIYPMILPQDTDYPALTYMRISGLEHHDIEVAYPWFQISCWAKSYSEAKGLANEIKMAFQRFKGKMGGAQGVDVVQGVYLNDRDLYDNETQVYHIPVNIRIIYKE
jgi:hypothetical protein